MGGDKQKTGKEGYPGDGAYYLADPQKLQAYTDASRDLSRFQAPVLVHANDPHEKLYVACFDGTGNDRNKDAVHETNVAKIDLQIRELNKTGDTQITSGYVPGPGTQDKFVPRTWDGITGHTYDQRTEQMYKQFIDQAKQWRQEDPKAEIRLAEIGLVGARTKCRALHVWCRSAASRIRRVLYTPAIRRARSSLSSTPNLRWWLPARRLKPWACSIR